MKLEEIGFYTMSDERAATASLATRLMRGEIVLTSECNFNCRYCRKVGGETLSRAKAFEALDLMIKRDVYAVRFSGGEPTMVPYLLQLVIHAKQEGVEKIAVSTNGSAPTALYDKLIQAGVNDFSISLDACCALDGDRISGLEGSWERVIENIRHVANKVYTTVGVVFNEDNKDTLVGIVQLAESLGVDDVRIIPAAQYDRFIPHLDAETEMPILKYRLENMRLGIPVRGLDSDDAPICPLALDDVAIAEGKHYPCIIAMREGAAPIGDVGPGMWDERGLWVLSHDPRADKICKNNCLDVCAEYNRRWFEKWEDR